MGLAHFRNDDFLGAARAVVAEHGPAAVTVGAVTARLGAPTGSFYHRFASRKVLLGELWLTTMLAFQRGFFAALDDGDGLAAMLYTPAWVRAHLDDARLLLLYHRNDFVQGEWPAALRQGVAEQARRFDASLEGFARDAFGGADAEPLRCARFLLVDVPRAAVRPHLERREPPPAIVDELIRTTHRAVTGAWSARRRSKSE
jgi:AcrR family transcriptional regulator